jgi:hypothetical protein
LRCDCSVEHPTPKRKYLYLLGTAHALKLLEGGQALSSVLSRRDQLQRMFLDRFGDRYRTVRDYYAVERGGVQIENHLAAFLDAHNFARRLKALLGLTPYEAICEAWAEEPDRFRVDPIHLTPGLNISSARAPIDTEQHTYS